MTKDLQKPVQVAVQELLNRQFQPEDIRQYLLEQGYMEEDIAKAFAAIKATESRNPEKTITPVQASGGFISLSEVLRC